MRSLVLILSTFFMGVATAEESFVDCTKITAIEIDALAKQLSSIELSKQALRCEGQAQMLRLLIKDNALQGDAALLIGINAEVAEAKAKHFSLLGIQKYRLIFE